MGKARVSYVKADAGYEATQELLYIESGRDKVGAGISPCKEEVQKN